MRTIFQFLLFLMPLLSHAGPHLKYDLKLRLNEDMSLLTTANIHVENVTTDTLRFSFGNALISYWVSTFSISNWNEFRLDTIQMEKFLYIPTHGQSSMDFSINYCFVPYVSVVTNSKATLYDNRGYENFLPALTEDYILEMAETEVIYPDGFEGIYPEHPENISDFYFLAYRTPDCRDRGYKKMGRMAIDYRLFTDSLSSVDRDLLFERVFSFCQLAADRLWPHKKLESTLLICEMPWIGNTTICDLMIYNSGAFRSTILYHELMHLWISPKLLDDKITGKFFLTETLNEYLMLHYLREIAPSKFNQLMDLKRKRVAEDMMKPSEALIHITKYVNSNHTYIMDYGVIVLDEFAMLVGRDKFQEFIEGFFKHSHEYRSCYATFRQQLIESFGENDCARFLQQIETLDIIN